MSISYGERLEMLVSEALALPPEERASYLERTCGFDQDLRAETESLLAQGGDAPDFLERLASEVGRELARLINSPADREGTRVSHYEILQELGSGGMGVIYRARDLRLGRTVALKFLPPSLSNDEAAKARFIREARAASALDHPNICTVHEIAEAEDGQTFIVMAFYEGETLDKMIREGGLPVDNAVTYAVQAAYGLQRAHEAGIIHRDIKPGNLLVTDRGTVKILDFGIAKLEDSGSTKTGTMLGTAAYMSPEQSYGNPVDERTDMWSLGVVLYEMLTGTRPFRGDRSEAVIHSVRHDEPLPLRAARPEVPERVERVVHTLLRKAPEDRYRSADELITALDGTYPPPSTAAEGRRGRRRTWLGATALLAVASLMAVVWAVWPLDAEPEPSIVVLPFVNMSPDRDNEYFSDGLTEEIITRLSAVPQLKVISRTSAMNYKGSLKPLPQIADELKVAHILEGSVRQSDGRVRITAQLIDAHADEHLWAENFDYEPRDILRVQEEIAREVVRALQIKLGEQEGRLLVKQGTRDPEAYELYRRGRHLWNKRTKEGHEQAIEYFRRAIERDSSYADAYAGLADVYLTAYQFNLSSMPEAEVYSRLKWAAERALALDEQSADAHASFAIALWWQRNWPGAKRELLRAIELNPGHATARAWHANLLAGFGRPEEAVREIRRANELDPFVAVSSSSYGWLCYLARDYDCSIEQHSRSLEIDPSWSHGYRGLGMAYAQQGMYEEAIRAVQKAIEVSPERPDFLADLAYVLAVGGNAEDALDVLHRAKLQPWEGFSIARAYVALGEPDSAFAWLERSSWRFPHRASRADPALDPLRSDRRFAQLSLRIEREMGIR